MDMNRTQLKPTIALPNKQIYQKYSATQGNLNKKNCGTLDGIVFDYYKLNCTDLRLDLEEFAE